MKIIGVCGQSGSGKTSFCNMMSERHIPVLDCDKIYHDLVSHDTPCLRQIAAAFGETTVQNGALDRTRLREIVFSDPAKLAALNALTHRYVLAECKNRIRQLEKEGHAYCAIDAPMLFEAGMESMCDIVLAVIAPADAQFKRLAQRDGISEESVSMRIRNQTSQEELQRKADRVILNDGDLARLEKQCDQFIETL